MTRQLKLAAMLLAYASFAGWYSLPALAVSVYPDLVPISQPILDYYQSLDEDQIALDEVQQSRDLLPKEQPELKKNLRSTYRVLSFLVKTFSRPLFGLQVTGSKALLHNQASLVVFNHPSTTEALPFAASLGHPAVFMIDKEWYEKPKLNKLFTTFDAISVDRTNGRTSRDSIRAVLEALRNGRTVVIAPDKGITKEGLMGLKRKHHNADSDLKTDDLGFKEVDYSTYNLAKKMQVPVILTSVVFQKRWFHGLVQRISFIPNILGFKLSLHFHTAKAPPSPSASQDDLRDYAIACRDTVNLKCLRMVGAIDTEK